ncbi:hypothetical protein [Frigidibacter mobilis]|uniref:Uncharacterized protein n=1 Tax=Frigidibacter mobilis TaxID=1335048 RepID=A0A159Z5M1_9RHOB|nr:hypothetical protein [Frigidibacter mobilis]AMY69674.1 hypothetical protein AKL17_2429 [Frigidibacter mobilis]
MPPTESVPVPEPIAPRLFRLEATVIAQRKLLLRLIAQSGVAGALRDDLARREVFQSHEEDPGVLPSAEYALEAAVAEELRHLAREIEALAELPGGTGPAAAG